VKLLARLVRALWVFGLIFVSYLAQYGLTLLVERWEKDPATGRERQELPDWVKRRRKRLDERNADRLLRGMLELRGVYIKLGQVLSIMGGFLPRAYTKKLEQLQDAVPPQPFEDHRARVLRIEPRQAALEGALRATSTRPRSRRRRSARCTSRGSSPRAKATKRPRSR
jgi:hypothetical protein